MSRSRAGDQSGGAVRRGGSGSSRCSHSGAARQHVRGGDGPDLEAVELFVERARPARAGFAVTDENAPARGGDLPPAGRAAAGDRAGGGAHPSCFSPRGAAGPARQPAELVTAAGARDLPARQQTLRDTIDWSYDLLMRRAGAGAVPAALRLRWGAGRSKQRRRCATRARISASTFSTVCRRSSTRAWFGPWMGSSASPRFTMLSTIREYALERLQSAGELEYTRKAHAAYYPGPGGRLGVRCGRACGVAGDVRCRICEPARGHGLHG